MVKDIIKFRNHWQLFLKYETSEIEITCGEALIDYYNYQSYKITVCHHLVSLEMPNCDPRNRLFYTYITPMKYLNNNRFSNGITIIYLSETVFC